MILLTRLDNSLVLVNLESVKLIDFTPDAVIHFLNGDSLIVRETLEDIESRVLDYRKKILSGTPASPAASSPSAPPV